MIRRIACLVAVEEPPGPAALLQVALAHSPRVEDAGPGRVYLDACGLEGLFGSEPRLAERLREAAAAAGLSVRVGIAGGRIAALAAARSGSGTTVVEPHGDAAFLAAMPLSLLEPGDDDLGARLSRWGLRTLGELATLPTAGLFERLGGEGVRLQRLARGDDPRPLASWRPAPGFEESVTCEWGMETLGPVIERLGELAGRLCARLGASGLAADGFEWVCRLAGGGVHAGALTPAVPMTDATAVAGLLRLALEARPPRGIVEGVTLRGRPVRAAPVQETFSDRSRPSPRRLAATLSRLGALVGADGVGAPALLDTHRPDAVALREYRPGETGASSPPAAVLTLRRLRPPAPAAVTLASGRPVAVRSSRLAGRIVAGVGPWRSSGEWWTECPWLQDEWDVELADGTLCRLVHDGSAWHLAGIYD
jgi:protein ImuB